MYHIRRFVVYPNMSQFPLRMTAFSDVIGKKFNSHINFQLIYQKSEMSPANMSGVHVRAILSYM